MKGPCRIGCFVFGGYCIFASVLTSVRAAEPFEGIWATTRKECLDSDRPTRRTQIDLTKAIGTKSSPIFDQYENHCKIIGTTAGIDNKTTLAGVCFEFWDNFRKGVDGKPRTIKLDLLSQGRLKIDGVLYWRCEKTRRKAAR